MNILSHDHVQCINAIKLTIHQGPKTGRSMALPQAYMQSLSGTMPVCRLASVQACIQFRTDNQQQFILELEFALATVMTRMITRNKLLDTTWKQQSIAARVQTRVSQKRLFLCKKVYYLMVAISKACAKLEHSHCLLEGVQS